MSAIGHQGVFRLSRWSCQIQAEFQGFRPTWEKHNKKNNDYAYRTLTRSGTAFQRLQLIRSFYQTFRTHDSRFTCAPTTPQLQRLSAITQPGFGLIRFRSPLLTESLLFSLPMGTEMFHFPTFPPHRLYIQRWVTRHYSCWVSPFGHPRITARLTAPRGLSQPPTSFFGSWCQGIHHLLLVT